MLKIAHIAKDEKFIDVAVDIFESVYPNQNTYYIDHAYPWKYIKDEERYIKLKQFKWIFMDRNELNSYDLVILHGLPHKWIVPMIMSKQNYVWLGWGFDYYTRTFGIPILSKELILDKTNSYVNKKIKTKSLSILQRIFQSHFFYKLAMRNVKVFSPVIPMEYDLVKNNIGLGNKTKYSPWNYGILEKHLLSNVDVNLTNKSNSIVLGNSATPTNNHFEAIDLLSKINSDRHVYMPLSYGDMEYAEKVKNYISEMPSFQQRCKILDGFLPLDEYNEIMNDCGFVIMNHVRQQGLGNIVTMMYKGAKIFLREESILYDFFKSEGAYIYTIQELESDYSLLDHNLNSSQIESNRLIISSIWSEKVIFERTKKLVEMALD